MADVDADPDQEVEEGEEDITVNEEEVDPNLEPFVYDPEVDEEPEQKDISEFYVEDPDVHDITPKEPDQGNNVEEEGQQEQQQGVEPEQEEKKEDVTYQDQEVDEYSSLMQEFLDKHAEIDQYNKKISEIRKSLTNINEQLMNFVAETPDQSIDTVHRAKENEKVTFAITFPPTPTRVTQKNLRPNVTSFVNSRFLSMSGAKKLNLIADLCQHIWSQCKAPAAKPKLEYEYETEKIKKEERKREAQEKKNAKTKIVPKGKNIELVAKAAAATNNVKVLIAKKPVSGQRIVPQAPVNKTTMSKANKTTAITTGTAKMVKKRPLTSSTSVNNLNQKISSLPTLDPNLFPAALLASQAKKPRMREGL